jgi:predicted ATP-grasp superfamily ATP-dependent carboligase
MDLYILNENMVKLGYFKSNNIVPGLSNDGLSLNDNEGNIIMPVEIYQSPDRKLTFFMMRSSVAHGKMRKFGDELNKFIKDNGFVNVIILSATMSPVKRERESNRQ